MTLSCPRCGEPLPTIHNGVPDFCPSCGLPQLRTSPEAVVKPASENSQADAAHGIVWARALWVTACVAAVGTLLPCCMPGAVVSGVAAGAGLLLLPLLALLLVVAYSRLRPLRVLAPTEGGTLGALLGALMGSLMACITGATGFVLRYLRHSHAMDDRIREAAAQVPTRLSAAGAIPQEVLGLIQSPEFRASTFILSHVFSMLLLIAVGSMCGWAAATLLHGRRQRVIAKS